MTSRADPLAAQTVAVLVTTRSDGSPRATAVQFAHADERVLVMSAEGRGKVRDIRRNGRAVLCVVAHEPPFEAVTIEGRAVVRTDGIARDAAVVMARITGRPIGRASDSALAAQCRVLIELHPERVLRANSGAKPEGFSSSSSASSA